jgi:hypothetical protein
MDEGRDNGSILATICRKSEAPKDEPLSWHCEVCNFWLESSHMRFNCMKLFEVMNFVSILTFLFSLTARAPASIQKKAFFQIGHDRRPNPGFDLVKI